MKVVKKCIDTTAPPTIASFAVLQLTTAIGYRFWLVSLVKGCERDLSSFLPDAHGRRTWDSKLATLRARVICYFCSNVAPEMNRQLVKDEPLPTPNTGGVWLEENPPKTRSAGEAVLKKNWLAVICVACLERWFDDAYWVVELLSFLRNTFPSISVHSSLTGIQQSGIQYESSSLDDASQLQSCCELAPCKGPHQG